MPNCTICDWCPVHLNTTEDHVVGIPNLGCITHPGPLPPPEGCNGTWGYDHATGKWLLRHLQGVCPKHP